MTHNPTRSPLDQDDFALNNIFIGREQQVILFNFYFQQWDAYFWQGMLRAYYYREPSHNGVIQKGTGSGIATDTAYAALLVGTRQSRFFRKVRERLVGRE